MDKVKKFLEQYVEWLAVVLGVAFLGWMVYSYVVLKPVSVAVGSEPSVAPSEVDPMIWDGPGKKLQAVIQSQTPPQVMGPQVDYPVIAGDARNIVPKSVNAVEPVPFTPIPVQPDLALASGAGPMPGLKDKIKRLPAAPALVDLQISGGHSNVPGPVASLANGAVAPAQGNQVVAEDKNWRTIEGTLHTADLAKSFADVGIVPGSPFSNTTILRVELIREERNVDGSWPREDAKDAEATEIPPLDIDALPPLPPIDASFADQKTYGEDFAQKSVALIVQPPFYQVLQGDVWYEPGTKNPNQVDEIDDNAFDPLNPGAYAGDPLKLLPSERKEYEDAKAKKAIQDALKARNQNRSNNNNLPPPGPPSDFQGPGGTGGGSTGGGSGGSRRGRGSGMVNDAEGNQSGGELPPPPSVLLPPTGIYPPQPGMYPPQGQPGSGQVSGAATLPAGSFDPSQQADIKMWAHDATVVAGKTYRYKLRYIISNPVARSNGLCDDPAMAKQFYIISKDSAWTDPVNVEADTNFFAVDEHHGIHFDVFKWKNGLWQMQSVQVNPGDMVGSVDNSPNGTKTDFTTGWTLVDIRGSTEADENDRTLVLVSENGTIITKQLATDQHSPAYRRLYLLANDPSKEKTVAGGGSPQIPPPIN
jgi:hypothetical protein